jgi:DNA-binding beta-propeller fold protein YncE
MTATIRGSSSRYIWHVHWVRIPVSAARDIGGRTHGVAVTRSGQVVVFAQANPAVYFFAPDGEEVVAWGDHFGGAHGLTLVEEEGTEFLWLTDQNSGAVVKATLDGRIVQEIERPDDLSYKPTWVAVNPTNGDIWVADGYGSQLVRRYDKDGTLIFTLTGDGAPDKFLCPHGIVFGPGGNLYLGDRSRKRIVVYDGAGNYVSHRDDVVHSPCMFAFHDNHIYVPELFGELKVLDHNLDVVSRIGTNLDVRPESGWLNQEGWGFPTLPGWPNHCEPKFEASERFIAPHSTSIAPDGTVYMVEWIIGGRVTKLSPR